MAFKDERDIEIARLRQVSAEGAEVIGELQDNLRYSNRLVQELAEWIVEEDDRSGRTVEDVLRIARESIALNTSDA